MPELKDVLCKGCGRKGFAWARNECSYCGQTNDDLPEGLLKSERQRKNDLYLSDYERSKELQKRLKQFAPTDPPSDNS